MTERSAVKVALGLLHLPASLRLIRAEPLPSDVELLLRIVSGDEACERQAALLSDRPRAMIREAAIFYVEQVLLTPGSDNYRTLGAAPSASSQDLRRHMALLLTWLHPDRNPSGDRAVLAARVTEAWHHLRTPERRAAYDAILAANGNRTAVSRRKFVPPSTSRGSKRPTPQWLLTATDRHDSREHRSLLKRGLVYLRRMLAPRL